MKKRSLQIPVTYERTDYMVAAHHYGDPRLPVIVLLNGSLFHCAQWTLFFRCALEPMLGDTYSFVMFDYGGTGNSGGQGLPWHVDRLAAEVRAVVAAISPESPVHLFGVSKGTIASQAFCALYPERVASHAGYGWFHLGYSNIAQVQAFFARRLKSFHFLQAYPYERSTRAQIQHIWEVAYKDIIGRATHSNRWFASLIALCIKPLLYYAITPTPLRTMYDWFSYGVQAMGEGSTWFTARRDALRRIPTFLMHARGDGTLPYAMAKELSEALPQAKLHTFEQGFNHVSPLVLPLQARAVVHTYKEFLHSLTSH